MKRLPLLITLAYALSVHVNAQTTNPILILSGIVNLPDRKCALLVARDARFHNLIHRLILSEGEREFEFEVLHINPARGTVEVRAAATNVLITLSGETEGTAANLPAITMEKADLSTVLNLYGEFSGRTILQFPSLPGVEFTLRASAMNRTEAAKVLEQALAAKDIVTIQDGDKFAIIVPKAQAAAARQQLGKTKFPITGKNQSLPPGFVNWSGADIGLVLSFYAELVGRKLDRSEPAFPSCLPIAFKNQTSLTKAEVVHAMDVLLEWRHVQVVAVGDDLIKPVLVSPK